MQLLRHKTKKEATRSLIVSIYASIVLIAFSFSSLLAPSVANTAIERTRSVPVSTLTVEGRLAVFDDAWETIDARYYDPKFNGIDWDKQRTTFRPLAAEATNGQELYVVLRRLIASLNDVHTRIYPPDEKFDWWNPRFVSIGMAVRDIDGLPTVVEVEKNSAAASAGVRPGDVIETVNDTPALSLIREHLSQLSTFSPSTTSRVFATLFEGVPQDFVKVSWQTKNGETKERRFERFWRTRHLGLRVHKAQGKYVVISLDAFTPSIALEFTRTMKRSLRGARGVVLDLRGNGGGEAEAMADIASTFLGAGVDLGTFSDRWGTSFTVRTRAKSLLGSEVLMQTDLPLVVLTSERTASAAEILVEALKSARRASLVGTETCGCVLAVRNEHTLPDGGILDVSELDYRTGRGIRLQENGIEPDHMVVLSRKDLYYNHDPVLADALRLFTTRSQTH